MNRPRNYFSLALLIFLAVFIFFPFSSLAKLEVEYPVISQMPPIPEEGTKLGVYIKYLFYFVITISGIIALGTIVMAGMQYLTSAGNPEKMKDARDRIFAALLGLMILFSSWLIINVINPDILKSKEILAPPGTSDLLGGVYLCRKWRKLEFQDVYDFYKDYIRDFEAFNTAEFEELESYHYLRMVDRVEKISEAKKKIAEECYRVDNSGNIKEDFDNQVTDYFLYPIQEWKKTSDGKNKYIITAIDGLILFEDYEYNRKCDDIWCSQTLDVEAGISVTGTSVKKTSLPPISGEFKPSSIITFRVDYSEKEPDFSHLKAMVFEQVMYNQKIKPGEEPSGEEFGGEEFGGEEPGGEEPGGEGNPVCPWPPGPHGKEEENIGEEQTLNLGGGEYSSGEYIPLDFCPRSIRVPEGLIVILDGGIHEAARSVVFTKDKASLLAILPATENFECLQTAPVGKQCADVFLNQAYLIAGHVY